MICDVLEEAQLVVGFVPEEFAKLFEWEWFEITFQNIGHCNGQDVSFFKGNVAFKDMIK